MSKMFDLSEKTILVTGGCGYLGSEMVKAILEFSGKVIVLDLCEDKSSCNVHYIQCNLSKIDEVKKVFSALKEQGVVLHGLVNCAAYGGGSGGKKSPFKIGDTTDELFSAGLDGTVGITFRIVREALGLFDTAAGGSIVNIASMYALVSPDHHMYGTTGQNSPPAYGAGKAAVLQLTRYLAGILAERNIRVNAITPGTFANPKGSINEEFIKTLMAKTMLKRIGAPGDLSGALVLLLSDSSRYMTASNIIIDGGWTAW